MRADFFFVIDTAGTGTPTGFVTLCEVSIPTFAADCSCDLRNCLLRRMVSLPVFTR